MVSGPDANLMVVPLKEMGRENHRMMSNLPQQPPIISAPKARFVVSWWDREVHVWILRKPAADLQDSAGEPVDVNQNRKLLKTIVVKGDSNIASATINQEGTLLFVSTPTDVKAFRLEHEDPARPSDVKLSSVELPAKLSQLGATQVRLSPDGRWLLAVQEGSRVLMASIQTEMTSTKASGASIRLQRLSRLRRQIPRYILSGGLGSYDRSITQVTFSADSKMVAVADLAGYIDTWVLRGHEQNLQNGQDMETVDDAASSASDSDSSDEEDEATTDMHDRWIRNPNAKLLPKLPASPAVLSFSDYVPEPESSAEAKEAGFDDYTLAVVTSSWTVLAFNPRHGALTPWSRRHPRKLLPAPVRDLIDLPKGLMWQGSRMWVYGVSFFLMLDMGQDLSVPSEVEGGDSQLTQGTKRKRTGRTTGAGGKMERETLVPHQVRKHGSDEQWEDIDVAEAPQADESDSDDDMPDADGDLSKLRSNPNGNETALQTTESTTDEPKKWWITYKYRPILGIVPIDSPGQDLEVALVERPTWDLDKPEGYFVAEEWDRRN